MNGTRNLGKNNDQSARMRKQIPIFIDATSPLKSSVNPVSVYLSGTSVLPVFERRSQYLVTWVHL